MHLGAKMRSVEGEAGSCVWVEAGKGGTNDEGVVDEADGGAAVSFSFSSPPAAAAACAAKKAPVLPISLFIGGTALAFRSASRTSHS